MRSPPQDGASHVVSTVRPLVDDEVGGRGVGAQQCAELTRTNRPRAYPPEAGVVLVGFLCRVFGFEGMSLNI